MRKLLHVTLFLAGTFGLAWAGLPHTAQAQGLGAFGLVGSTDPAQSLECGCQGNCGWISDGCCEGDCCIPTITGRLEYLLWWGRGQNIPPLVTTSPQGTPQAQSGVLPGATVLFGDEAIQQNLRSGGRITLNYLLDDGETNLGGRFWGLENSRDSFFASSDGDPILARPFFNTLIPGEDALLVAFPGVTDNGRVLVQADNSALGADAWLRQCMVRDACFQMDWLVGYQFLRMDDSLVIRNSQQDIQGTAVPIGTVIGLSDSFRTRNQFHGATLGVTVENRCGPWQLDLLAKLAIGNMHETFIIRGRQVVTQPNGVPPAVSNFGLLAQGTNSGTTTEDRLAFIPEVNCNLGYRVNECWSLTLGYSFMYLSDVAVAGGQIDRTVNLSQNPGPIVGAARPTRLDANTDYWFQGLSLGADFRY